MKPSVCMMVKDEEDNIRRCLDSVIKLKDLVKMEIIVVDTGSKDNTVKIVRKFTNEIYFKPWENNFSDIRNYSVSKAKGEWILITDADEEIEAVSNIAAFINSSNSKLYNTIAFKVVNIINLQNELERITSTSDQDV